MAHNLKFPQGRAFGQEVEESLQHLDKLRGELDWARRDLDMRQKYHDAKLANEAREAHAGLPKNRMFEVRDSDGRIVRHRAASADQLRLELVPGYIVVSECFGFAADGSGGISAALDSSVPSIMAGLLLAHGQEFISWLEMHGFERKGGAA